MGADGEIAVEPDRQPGVAPSCGRRRQLAFGLPLQKQEEPDAFLMGGREFGQGRPARIAECRRPVAPGERSAVAVKMLVQRFENGEVGKRPPARAPEIRERLALRARRIAAASSSRSQNRR